MAFYQTNSYRNYETRDPLVQIRNDITLANSNITIGAPAYEVSEAGTQVVPAINLVNNTIIRTTNSGDIETDTAANILSALRNKLRASINQVFGDIRTFPNGTRFSFVIINKSGGGIDFLDDNANGVYYDNTGGSTIANTLSTTMIMTVCSQVLLGDSDDIITITNTDY